MKHLFRMLLPALLIAVGAQAQQKEYTFANHHVSFVQIEKEWGEQHVYSAGDQDSPDIRAYFLGFSHTYPNDIVQRMVDVMVGLGGEINFGDTYVCDLQHGYIGAEAMTELSIAVQMRYWRCNDGSILIGVAVEGDEYTDGDCDDRSTVNVNAMQFYRTTTDIALWTPYPMKEICGKNYKLSTYHIQLPRQGNDIVLTHQSKPSASVVLKWNGNGFTPSK
ncbi:MAG: hypothetical protein J6I60_06520 [Bacteroidaceae bacterium]|nr:hypothetical protein [Bacteroidaceae bacterium]